MKLALSVCVGALIVLTLSAPVAADEPPARFHRAINLSGRALEIDGQSWEANDAKDFVCNGKSFESQSVLLKPETDRARAEMIRGSRWGNPIDITLTNVSSGTYQVFLYVWEDNDSTRFDVLLNGQTVVARFDSRGAGIWKKLGPWPVKITAGEIRLSARGGDANLSGLEIWSGAGPIPMSTASTQFAAVATPEQKEFFERSIRPLLVQKCYECHSADAKKVGGSLLLDSRAGIVKEGDTEPPIVPGDPDGSLLMTAVRYAEQSLQMPPKGKLSPTEIADLERWIRDGAPDPRIEDTTRSVSAKPSIDWDKARQFWSLQQLQRPIVPPVQNQAWPVTDIDRFLLAKMEQAQLQPTADCEKPTLLRRVTYDLIGLPPTPEEIDAFVADTSPEALSHVVERLLASPQYGERWGRYWLDVVRYADTAGDNSDFPIPQMYRYRNWVIGAFNRDLPYDQFIRQQLAGDLLPAASETERIEQTIATGYIANARRFGSRVDDYPQHLTIEDTLDNLGRAFLGLTINCARCHDHKFDPITNQDYYGLYGIFASTRYPWPGIELEQKQRDLVPLVLPAQYDAAVQAHRQEQARLDGEVARLEKERKSAQGDEQKSIDKILQEARKAAERHGKTALPIELGYAVAESKEIQDARVQTKGDPLKPGALVPRRFLTVLGGMEIPADDHTSGRLKLAEWISSRSNPLTACVLVNRVWLHHFGRGLVPTPNDFGKQGKPPTHPELLDYLAVTFMDSGWSIKSLHRAIVLSHAYRQDSLRSPVSIARDVNNDLLSAYPRQRLDAEAIRDTLLVLGGNLDPTQGGPHPFPPQTEWKFTQHNPFKAIYETNGRSVYLMTQRIQRHPYLAIFDGPDTSASTPQRITSTTPLQALFLLNDPFVHEQAQRFADRLLTGEPNAAHNDSERIRRAYRLALGGPAEADELEASTQFLTTVRDEYRSTGVPADQIDRQTWQAFSRALFRLSEFVYID